MTESQYNYEDVQIKLKECNFIYPCMEDVVSLYKNRMHNILFPKDIDNKFLVYFFNCFHIFGTLMIQFGIFFPPKYMPLYLIYILMILAGYKLLENNCFMTVLSNYYSGKDDNPLYVRMETVRNLVIRNIIIAVYNYVNPELSLYSLIKMGINYMEYIPFMIIVSFLVICIIFLALSTYLMKSGKYVKNRENQN